MRPVPAAASRQFGAFTAQQARHAGWTESALRHAVRSGALDRVRFGVYACPIEWSGNPHRDADRRLALASAAVALANPRVPISHSSAASLMELPLVDAPAHVCATTPRGRRDDVRATHLHHGRVAAGDLFRANRILVTSPARTVVDIGCESGAAASIAAADAALRRGLVTTAQLDAALTHATGWPGVRAARAAITLADARAESPLESASRLRVRTAGLPAPELQKRIVDDGGRFVGRVDLYWDEFGVVGETDGLAKYDDQRGTSLREEKLRQEHLERCGLIVVRWGWADLADFERVATRLRDAFTRGARRGRVDRRWTPQSAA